MKEELKKGEIIIYKSAEGPKIEVKLDKENIWLTQDQIALLFGTKRPAITKHLNNIFQSGELDEKSNVPKWNIPNSDKPVKFYSLDAVIAVGYRVNSKRATQFRVWATNTLKSYLVKGYVVDEKRLLEAENRFKELQNAVDFLRQKAKHELLAGQEQEILSLLADYSKTLTLLEQYDTEKLSTSKSGQGKFVLNYEIASKIIVEIKKELVVKKEASDCSVQMRKINCLAYWETSCKLLTKKNFIQA